MRFLTKCAERLFLFRQILQKDIAVIQTKNSCNFFILQEVQKQNLIHKYLLLST